MLQFILTTLLCGLTIGSSISWPWHGYITQSYETYVPQPAGDCDYDSESAKGDVHHEYEQYNQNGCACLFYVGDVLVFRRENTSIWHSCTGWGAYNCYQYCNEMQQDETMQYRIHQDSCDILGTEIHTQWYRRHQVCGPYGPYEDILLQDTLCCKRGRPADNC